VWIHDAELCLRRRTGNLNTTEWASVVSDTKVKPKGHSVKEEEVRGRGGWGKVIGFKILNGKSILI
jgi:hypothetical protein